MSESVKSPRRSRKSPVVESPVPEEIVSPVVEEIVPEESPEESPLPEWVSSLPLPVGEGVVRVSNGRGQFLKDRRVVRRSGSVVSVWDLSRDVSGVFGEVEISSVVSSPVKYVVVCESHGSIMGSRSYEGGWRGMLSPASFCPSCESPSVVE